MSKEDGRKYENDVFYEVWRRGGNPDDINYDRVDDHFSNHDYPEVAADTELRKQVKRQKQGDKEVLDEQEK